MDKHSKPPLQPVMQTWEESPGTSLKHSVKILDVAQLKVNLIICSSFNVYTNVFCTNKNKQNVI